MNTCTIVIAAVLTVCSFFSTCHIHGQVILDSVSDGEFNNITIPGVLNFAGGFGGMSQVEDASVFITAIGNGKNLKQVEVVWQYASSMGLNTGDFEQFDWSISLFADPNRATTEGAFRRLGSEPPDFSNLFLEPSNSDYAVPIGNAGGANNHLATFNLAELQWPTIRGEEFAICVAPVATMPGNDTITALAFTSCPCGPLDLYDVSTDNGMNATSFKDRGLPFDRVAALITTVEIDLLGDVNQDGTVDLLDVAPFVELLTNGDFQAEADINQDGIVDLLDVAPFVDLLAGG